MSLCAGCLYVRAINEPEYDGSYGSKAPCYTSVEVRDCGDSEGASQGTLVMDGTVRHDSSLPARPANGGLRGYVYREFLGGV